MINCFQFCFNFAFNFNLRRYNEVYARLAPASAAQAKEADTWVALGSRQFIESGFDQSLESFTQALTLRRQALGRSHALTAAAESDCGVASGLAGHPEQAVVHHRAALEARSYP